MPCSVFPGCISRRWSLASLHMWSPDSSSNQNPAHFQLGMEATVMVEGLTLLYYLVSSYMEIAGIYPLYSMPLGIWGALFSCS